MILCINFIWYAYRFYPRCAKSSAKRACISHASKSMPYKKLKSNPAHEITAMFQEAISHSRRKGALRTLLMSHEFQDVAQYANQSFDDIFLHIHTLCYVPKTIGLLCIYDITAAICRHNNINIDHIFIIGKGPQRAVRILGLKPKKHTIGDIVLNYVEIKDVVTAFQKHGYTLDLSTKNGDEFESYLCKWQKSK